jgi:hypothetical protein
MPNKWTFLLPPVKKILELYVGDGCNWLDPFSGCYSPAEYTNDLNPDAPSKFHMEAVDFLNSREGEFSGLLFDPPYSPRQISECYKSFGLKTNYLTTSAQFYAKVKDAAAKHVAVGGTAISFGWNSGGMGMSRGFEKKMILVIGHGGSHNDTIVTVETRIR